MREEQVAVARGGRDHERLELALLRLGRSALPPAPYLATATT